MLTSSFFDKIFRFLKFSGNIVRFRTYHFPIQDILYQPIQKYLWNYFFFYLFISQSIFKVFAAHFTTNLDLDIGKKIFKYFAFRQIDKILPENSFSEVRFNTINLFETY